MQAILLICTFAVGALGHTSIRLDPDFNVMFHMSTVPNRIEIEVKAKTTGWVGFGFSHSASMTNADMVIGGLNGTNNESIYHGVSIACSSQNYVFSQNFYSGCRTIGRQIVMQFQHWIINKIGTS